VIVREPELADLPTISQLAPERPDIVPDPSTLQSAIVLSDDCMVAYGALKLYAEFVLAVNKSVAAQTRAEAIKTLVHVGVGVCRRRSIEEVHTFAADGEFGQFLEKHFGFVPIAEKPFVLTLR
jgi:hypothetical protein